MPRILVIKHGALGDFVLALGPFRAIRAHHAADHITLLTTAPFAGLANACGCFDEVWIDPRAKASRLAAWLNTATRLWRARFARVYDLQHSDRTHLYFRLMTLARHPEWSGIAPGCSHPHANPARDSLHTIERQAEQLAMAGIGETPHGDLGFISAEVGRFALPARYVLLVPGGAAHRPGKRWPAAAYGEVAAWLAGRGIAPVLIGGGAERAALGDIAGREPGAINLCERTTLEDVAALAREALAAVGNDTGPMHLIAAGCPSVVLFSRDSDPAVTAPRGTAVEVLRRDRLNELPAAEVMGALEGFLSRTQASR